MASQDKRKDALFFMDANLSISGTNINGSKTGKINPAKVWKILGKALARLPQI